MSDNDTDQFTDTRAVKTLLDAIDGLTVEELKGNIKTIDIAIASMEKEKLRINQILALKGEKILVRKPRKKAAKKDPGKKKDDPPALKAMAEGAS